MRRSIVRADGRIVAEPAQPGGAARRRVSAGIDLGLIHVDDDIVIRPMAPEEADEVADLVVGAYAGDFALSDPYRAEIAAVAGRAVEHEVWVAADASDGALLGTVSTPRAGRAISPLARDGELDFRFLGVAHAARSRGVGGRLVEHVLALAAERGIHRVVLNTGPDMLAAQRLYERMGFDRLHEREYVFERSDGTSFLMLAYGLDVGGGAASPDGPRRRN
jgi:ribosomal protein S18 acetylase RimI-like enzyme